MKISIKNIVLDNNNIKIQAIKEGVTRKVFMVTCSCDDNKSPSDVAMAI
jgi:hypothetical protein